MRISSDQADFTQALKALIKKTQNLKPVLSAIAQYQERQLQKAFDKNQAPDGTPWQPLALSTQAQKRNDKMLVESVGRIPGSRFSEATNTKVRVGYADPLAAIHHKGAIIPARTVVPKNKQALFWAGARHPVKRVNIPETRLPARPLIGYSQADVREWVAIVEVDILTALR